MKLSFQQVDLESRDNYSFAGQDLFAAVGILGRDLELEGYASLQTHALRDCNDLFATKSNI